MTADDDPRAFGVLVTARGLLDPAVEQLAPRAREVIVPVTPGAEST